MRRLGALAVAVGLASFPRDSPAPGLSPVTCDFPEASFGVLLDEDALAAGELDDIYVDGVVAIPVRLGLGLAKIQSLTQLVDSGLVNVDVYTEAGALLQGSLELVHGDFVMSEERAYPAWLVWTGGEAFEPDSRYQFEFSFLNDTLSDCPAAISSSGTRVLTTGTRHAREDLVAPKISSVGLSPRYDGIPACCAIAESEPCREQARCFACWSTTVRPGSGSIMVESRPHPGYFALDFTLLAGESEQPLANSNLLYANVEIGDSASEYCFVASLRPRASGDTAIESVEQCVASDSYLLNEVPLGLSEMPAEWCDDGPLSEHREQGWRALAAFGTTAEEAQAIITPPAMAGPSGGATSTPGVRDTRRESSCTFGRGNGLCSGWLAAVGFLALCWCRRRRTLRNP